MTRFFSDSDSISGNTIYLSANIMDHVRSLRLRPDERFVVCDGNGFDYICKLGAFGDASAEIIERRPTQGEPTVICSVFVAFAKGDRLEYAVQKSVELGAFEIVLFPSHRCVSSPGDHIKKIVRLQRISEEAAKQSGRGRIPIVSALDSYEAAIRKAACAALPMFFYEGEEELHLKQALERLGEHNSISIVTGPEGGFELFEVESARAAGMSIVTLGSRVLRCETAPAAVLAAVMFHTGNF